MSVAVRCPHCDDGSVVHGGAGLWWQSRRGRCAWCQGVRWIIPEEREVVTNAIEYLDGRAS